MKDETAEIIEDEEIPDEQYFERARSLPPDGAELEGEIARDGEVPEDEILEQLESLHRHAR